MSNDERPADGVSLDDLLDATVEVPAVLLLGAACCGCCGGRPRRDRVGPGYCW